LEVALQELTIKTNGGPTRSWERTSQHWQPVFKLSHDGKPATDWESSEWVAKDGTGNRGQTFGLHEPVLKFIATARPKPEAVSDSTRRWRLPPASIQTIGKGVQWNTNHVTGDVSITVIGLFQPGAYTLHSSWRMAINTTSSNTPHFLTRCRNKPSRFRPIFSNTRPDAGFLTM